MFVFSDKLETSASADTLERRHIQQSGWPCCSDAGGIRYQGMVPLTSGHGVRKDQAVCPLHGASVGQGRCTAAPGLATQGGFWGGRSSGEHLQQRALGRAFLLRVSWQLFRASETVSAMGSSSLKVKESKPRARVAAEVAEA